MKNADMIDVETKECLYCHERGVVRDVSVYGLARFLAGEYIQVALPTLNADEREQILTGTHPQCWIAMMPLEDDGDDDPTYHP